MKRKKLNKKNINKLWEDVIEKSIESLDKNSKAMERAIEQVLKEDDIKASEKEYLEIKSLTDTLEAIDSALSNLGE